MTVDRNISRRQLLGQAAGVALASTVLPGYAASGQKSPGPNDQVGVGIIGCGRRNGQLMIGKGGQG